MDTIIQWSLFCLSIVIYMYSGYRLNLAIKKERHVETILEDIKKERENTLSDFQDFKDSRNSRKALG